MPQFFIAYLGGDRPKTKEEGQQHFAKYQAWLAELGDAVISPANPFKDTTILSPDGSTSTGSKTGMSGYTLVEASSLEAALTMAQNCPFLEVNGTLEVSQIIQMA